MSEARRKWWLRTVAAVLGGGGTLTGAWIGFSRADHNPPLTQVSEQLTNVAQIPPPEPFERPRPIDVMPISATAPAALPPVVEPIVPMIPSAGPEMGLQQPASLPLPPAPASQPVTVPALPAIPDAKPIIPVAAPFPPSDIPPLPTPSVPAIPAPTATPKPTAIPPLPAIETPKLPAVPTAEKPKVPAIPTTPLDLGVPSVAAPVPVVPVEPAKPKLPESTRAPALPAVPDFAAPPTPTGLTPPPLPAKVAEPVVPSLPAKTDSGLPLSNGGINVKPEKVGEKPAPVVPVVPTLTVPETVKVPEPAKVTAPVKVPEDTDGGFKIPVTTVKAPSLSEPPVIAPKLPAVPAIGKPETPGTVVDRPKPVEPPLRDPEKNFSPIPSNPLVTTPGDNTMIPLSRSAAAAVLGGMLLAPTQPVHAVTPTVPSPTRAITTVAPIQADDSKADKSEVAELKKQVEESNRKLTAIQEQLKALTEALSGKKDDKGFPLSSDRGVVADLKEFKDRLAQIEKDLANYKSQSSSLRPSNPITNPITPSNAIVDPKANKGTIRVVNEYPVQISIVVNGTSYRIAPSKALDVDVTAGEFSYQLLEAGGAVTKSVIKEKETVTLRIK